MKDDKKVTGWKATIAQQIDGALPDDRAATAVKESAYFIAAGIAAENGGSVSTDDIARSVRLAVGGSITGEHGVGIEKLDAMCTQFTDAERAQMLAFKAAFDPLAMLNPGKLIPMLARCGELRPAPGQKLGQTPALSEALAGLPRF